MIVTEIKGGLGNQLFQYATARYLSTIHRCELVIDNTWYLKPQKNETFRTLELDKLNTHMRLATLDERHSWRFYRSRLCQTDFLQRLIRPLQPAPLKFIQERGNQANMNLKDAPNFTYLSGAWQSELYFSDIRDDLLKEISLLPQFNPTCIEIDSQIAQSNSVSVHVRRGDYVSNTKAKAYHGLSTLRYYKNAINYILERVESPTFFVFSDEPEWVKKNLHLPCNARYVEHNSPTNAIVDLHLMSLCQHHVVANSSFSWWGAWLSRSANQIVIAPEQWYAVDRPTPDLIPARWIRMAG